MQLKTNVWVNKITSLSEARYCAGMGVQYLGFQPSKVDIKTFQDITGWISGPEFFLDVSEEEQIPSQLEDYGCEYVLLRENQVAEWPGSEQAKLLIKKDLTGASPLPDAHAAFTVLPNWSVDSLPQTPESFIATVTDPQQLHALAHLPLGGILLEGSPEAKPGLMEYDHLAAILELLETND